MQEDSLNANLGQKNKSQKKSNAIAVSFKEIDRHTGNWIQSWNPYHPDALKTRTLQPVHLEESQLRKRVAQVLGLTFVGFMIWAILAPLDVGVPATGVVKVSGYRKELQHPTGGVVQEILIKEGDLVQEGDILIRINPLKANADFITADLQYINALVTEARLMAEKNGQGMIKWSPEIMARVKETSVKEAMALQQKLFETRRSDFLKNINSRQASLVTIREEAKNNEELAKEGYVSRAQANQAMRQKIDQESALEQVKGAYYKEVDTMLTEVQKSRDAYKGNLESMIFTRDLAAIRAPVTGTVVGLKVNTIGGTISAGQVLGEIVPRDAALIIDAQIPVIGIEQIQAGMSANLRFTSLNTHLTPVIKGQVIRINPDKQSADPSSGKDQDYYLGQISASKEELAKLGQGINIQPGMPVTVVFKTKEQNFISYLFKPLADRYAISFTH